MSTLFVEVVEIADVRPHPNADRLEIAQVKGATVIVPKGAFHPSQTAVYFPADMLIPEAVAEQFGVKQYLKYAELHGIRCQCRVAATRLRGSASYGFLVSMQDAGMAVLQTSERFEIGQDVSDWFEAVKYEPPVAVNNGGDPAPEHPKFHRYTNIEHFWRHPDAIEEGTPVRITEKVHGTNARLGLIALGNGEFEFMAGSHKVNRKPSETCRYWSMMDENVIRLLTYLCDEANSAVLFGEIYGPGIQDLDYGGLEHSFRAFDISVNGDYLPWWDVHDICSRFAVAEVPLLYHGPFNKALVEQHTHGPTTLSVAGAIRSKFRGREGCVITPLYEKYSREMCGRLVLKSVSADYLDRKGAVDNG